MLVLTVDPDPMVGKVLRFLFGEQGYQTLTVEHASAARALLDRYDPELIVLEADLPDVDGFAFCEELRADGVTGGLMFVTSRDDRASRIRGLDRGADDYLVKPFDPAELLARVRAVIRRTQQHSELTYQPRLRAAGLDLDLALNQVTLPGGEAVVLTPTETRLLECLLRHANRVVSRETLTDWVWGYDCEGSSNRIEVYIRRLRRKLWDSRGEPPMIETARGHGYRLMAPREAGLRKVV